MPAANLPAIRAGRPAWNKGRIIGQKRPLLLKHVWAIRVRLELAERHRDLALFNLAIDSKLRGCDLVKLRVADVFAANQVKERASIIQSKTGRPVRFEITEGTRRSLARWMAEPSMIGSSISGRGVSTNAFTSLRDSMPGSCANGFRPSGWNPHHTGRIPCGGPRWRRFIGKRGTCGPCSFFLGTQRWTVRFDIWAWIWKMPLRSRKA